MLTCIFEWLYKILHDGGKKPRMIKKFHIIETKHMDTYKRCDASFITVCVDIALALEYRVASARIYKTSQIDRLLHREFPIRKLYIEDGNIERSDRSELSDIWSRISDHVVRLIFVRDDNVLWCGQEVFWLEVKNIILFFSSFKIIFPQDKSMI